MLEWIHQDMQISNHISETCLNKQQNDEKQAGNRCVMCLVKMHKAFFSEYCMHWFPAGLVIAYLI